MNVMSDERGFLHIYLMGMFAIGCVIMFAIMLGTFASARQNAVTAYSWLIEAGDFTANEAAMNGITSANYQTASEVETYFENSYSGITQTRQSGSDFTPAAGSPFPGPIILTSFTQYSQGEALPNNEGTANEDGFLVSMNVPVLSVVFPYVGQEPEIIVPMSYYIAL